MDYKQFCAAMWEIQRSVRKYKNHAASLYFDYTQKRQSHHDQHGAWPLDSELLGGTNIRTLLYRKAAEMIPDLQTGNASAVSQSVHSRLKNDSKAMFIGDKSLPSFKKDQPINISKQSIKLFEENGKTYITISVFSKTGTGRLALGSGRLTFEVWRKSKSGYDIVNRCISGEYSYGASKLQYDRDKKMWELALSYEPPAKSPEFETNRICGIDVGYICPVYAAVNDGYERFSVESGDIEQFRKNVEARRRDMQKARPSAGGGSVGHGYKTRMAPVLEMENRIARYRDTKNHQYSKALIDFAIKNRCGVIQIRDLSGITAGQHSLKNWSYYDLQQKITYKAEESGITVVIVNAHYTSQRCHKCGYISEDSKQGRVFVCGKCKYRGHIDFNSAKNVSLANIDEITDEYAETLKSERRKGGESNDDIH